MTGFFFLVDQLATGLYALLGVVVMWQLYRLNGAQGELRSSYFELERDLASQRRYAALTSIVIAFEVGIIILGVQMQVVPFLESERTIEERLEVQRQQIRDGVFATDTPPAAVASGPDIEIGTPLGGQEETGFISTPTPTPTPVGTIVPNAPPISGCEDDRAFLQIPANGMRIFAPVTVRGTAFVDNFSQAKLEIQGPSTNGQYVPVYTIDQPVRQMNDITLFIPARYETGLYQFRLTVFDLSLELRASCMVNIYISEPPVTPTPTPTANPVQVEATATP
jgi:hypothetical protein